MESRGKLVILSMERFTVLSSEKSSSMNEREREIVRKENEQIICCIFETSAFLFSFAMETTLFRDYFSLYQNQNRGRREKSTEKERLNNPLPLL